MVEDALREMLTRVADEDSRPAFRLPTHGSGGLHPGVDLDDKEALAERLGDNARP